jgi:hypothetical protein
MAILQQETAVSFIYDAHYQFFAPTAACNGLAAFS